MADDLELDVDLEPDPEPAEVNPDDEPAEPAEPPEQLADAPPSDQPPPQEPERQPTRGENRFQALRNENQRLDRDLAETRRRLDEISQRMAQPQVQRESSEQRAARFALMTPQEQMAETLRDSEQRQAQWGQTLQAQMLETADRAAFQAKAAVDPLYAKWGPKVEGKLAELRATGKNIEREVLLDWMIGNTARLNRESKRSQVEVKQAQRRVAAQRTRPANAASDTQAQRRGGQTLEQRLENVQI